MTKEEIRLEALKLAHTHGRETAQVVERARAYEEYVTGVSTSTVVMDDPAAPKRGRKKAGNSAVENLLD